MIGKKKVSGPGDLVGERRHVDALGLEGRRGGCVAAGIAGNTTPLSPTIFWQSGEPRYSTHFAAAGLLSAGPDRVGQAVEHAGPLAARPERQGRDSGLHALVTEQLLIIHEPLVIMAYLPAPKRSLTLCRSPRRGRACSPFDQARTSRWSAGTPGCRSCSACPRVLVGVVEVRWCQVRAPLGLADRRRRRPVQAEAVHLDLLLSKPARRRAYPSVDRQVRDELLVAAAVGRVPGQRRQRRGSTPGVLEHRRVVEQCDRVEVLGQAVPFAVAADPQVGQSLGRRCRS